MQQVKVNTQELITKVQANRDAHRGLYEEAMEGYKNAVMAWLLLQIDYAKANAPFETYFNEARPEDHTDDYDNVLDMLKMTVDKEVVLNQHEFRQYVRDDWGWKNEFLATATSYTRHG